ncbi:MAG: type I restriction-modification system subunit M [Thermoanaerobacteraceae bacterium]|nr:type I restriction-modification system subunit M [Thermoanaerobacteraceae bacterium]
MAIKKSDLYSKLWKSCDELRGGMDASQYKDYILVLLFMRYVTDKYYGKKDALIEVPEGGSFKDLVKLKGDKEIGDKINKVIRKMADANDLVGVITVADFNDSDKLGKGKEMVDRLTNLIAIFEDEELNFSKNGADGDDILGDAYEYLMRHFATESGKSKGQFYTPAEVSRVMAKVIGIDKAKSTDQTIYDPTCGSGSLLLKAADEAPVKVTIYGQEKDVATVALAKMNMILHGNETADIRQGDTLASPEFIDDGSLKTFHFAVANPPFSLKSWSNGLDPNNDPYKRFEGYGIPPAKNGDYAFLLHFIKSLRSDGKGAIILPHGVLFRGNTEAEIRKNIVKRGYIKGIIGLPANLFYGTGIPACIIVIDKENAEARKGIFMIDASKGYMKDGNKNRLREQDIRKIVDVFNNQLEIPKYSRMVPLDEIEKNEYNLNIPRYIDTQEDEDIQDIEAHLLGGIPNRDIDKLQKYWDVYPSLRSALFADSDRAGYSKLKIEKDKIKQTIFEHDEFKAYAKEIHTIIDNWRKKHTPLLKSINQQTHPKALINEISEDILQAFENNKLIDKYDIYQHLMDYWLETMKDDVYMIVENGWVANNDLIPEELVINRYFRVEQQAIEELELARDEITRQKEEFEEENSGEEGVMEDLKNDKGKITKGSVQARIKEIKNDEDAADELKILKEYLNLIDKEAKANKKIKEAQKKLDEKVVKKYKELTVDEIKSLIVDYKWMTSIINEVSAEMERISHKLTSRIKELAERYEETLPQIENELEEFEKKVESHLKRMGFAW